MITIKKYEEFKNHLNGFGSGKSISIRMLWNVLQILLFYAVYIYAFEELIFAAGQDSKEMMEKGKTEYQIIKERSNLPKYGSCWKSAVEHLDEGCKYFSEETQSDIALHLTNCFLEMSGHITYNCELDKKPNLRAICINSMSERAFNVYTEFFTHTQNICWFLRGQIWQETISENTWKVGKQLELTAVFQENLLKAQQESLDLQDRMLKHGKNLEQVLENLQESSNAHRDVLILLSKSISNLQSWLIGEISWFDSIVFYLIIIFVIILLTSTQRTESARFPLSVLLILNLIFERMVCSYMTSYSQDFNILTMYLRMYDFIWYTRYCFVIITIFTFLYKLIYHNNINYKNNEILHQIYAQNKLVLKVLDYMKFKLVPDSIYSKDSKYFAYMNNSQIENEKCVNSSIEEMNNSLSKYHGENNLTKDINLSKNSDKFVNKMTFSRKIKNVYNLRSSSSRQGTPDF